MALRLFAANGTAISVYGKKKLYLNLGLLRDFAWIFLVADVGQPIIGADFLKYFGLLVDLRKRRLLDEMTVCSSSVGLPSGATRRYI